MWMKLTTAAITATSRTAAAVSLLIAVVVAHRDHLRHAASPSTAAAPASHQRLARTPIVAQKPKLNRYGAHARVGPPGNGRGTDVRVLRGCRRGPEGTLTGP